MRIEFVGALAVLASCVQSSTCPDGASQAPVHQGRGGYVCIPDNVSDAPSPTTSAPTTFLDASLPPPSLGTDAGLGSCPTVDAGALEVRVVPRSGAPSVPSSTPKDGAYVLAQANAYPSDAGATLFQLRATLLVTGAKLELGVQAEADANESFTATFVNGVLTKVCETRAGLFSSNLFPGTAGATIPATFGADASGVITLVLGAVELVLVPR